MALLKGVVRLTAGLRRALHPTAEARRIRPMVSSERPFEMVSASMAASRPVTVWILGDQLLQAHPALAAAEALVGRAHVRVLLIESAARLAQQPYQRKKLVLLLSAMRHYAAELEAAGFTVDYRRAPDFAHGLRAHLDAHGSARLLMMAAAEQPTRRLQEGLATTLGVPVEVLPNTQFLVGQFDPFPAADPARTPIMATFYKAMRRHFGVLLEPDGSPIGGQWS